MLLVVQILWLRSRQDWWRGEKQSHQSAASTVSEGVALALLKCRGYTEPEKSHSLPTRPLPGSSRQLYFLEFYSKQHGGFTLILAIDWNTVRTN